jgi:predicted ATPase
MEQSTICRIVMATHSPMLMAYPNIAHGWITMHASGAYLSFTQEGADLFA